MVRDNDRLWGLLFCPRSATLIRCVTIILFFECAKMTANIMLVVLILESHSHS
jgi:hypothetical protein